MTKDLLVELVEDLDPFAGIDGFAIPKRRRLNADAVAALPKTAKLPTGMVAVVAVGDGAIQYVKRGRVQMPGAVWYVNVRVHLPGADSVLLYLLGDDYFSLPQF
jgi:hypothetical protein